MTQHASNAMSTAMPVVVAAFSLALCLVRAADAQVVYGSVYESASDQGVPNATVRLLDDEDRAQLWVSTDADGSFHMRALRSGSFRLEVEVIGYAPTETGRFMLGPADSLGLEIRIEYAPVALEPLIVAVYNENRAGFERRRTLSYGTRIGPEQMAEIGDRTLNQFASQHAPFLSWGGTFDGLYTFPLMSRGRRCSPVIFIDGAEFRTAPGIVPDLDRWVNPEDVRAIEVYPDGSLLPSPFFALAREPRGTPPCGLIAVWTTDGFGVGGVE